MRAEPSLSANRFLDLANTFAMTDEPYRWLEAISNRRDYVREQLKGGSPAFAVSLTEGILLLGVGSGSSKVFELHDRHAMAGLGHPADIERIRQTAIDAAHIEAFTRAAEDVSLRRLVGFGLSAQVKQNFEQLFTAPVLGEFVFAELGDTPAHDHLVRLRFDGSFATQSGGVCIVAPEAEAEAAAQEWLSREIESRTSLESIADLLLQTWWCLKEGMSFPPKATVESERQSGWKTALAGKTIEAAFLRRQSPRIARYETLTLNKDTLEIH